MLAPLNSQENLVDQASYLLTASGRSILTLFFNIYVYLFSGNSKNINEEYILY